MNRAIRREKLCGEGATGASILLWKTIRRQSTELVQDCVRLSVRDLARWRRTMSTIDIISDLWRKIPVHGFGLSIHGLNMLGIHGRGGDLESKTSRRKRQSYGRITSPEGYNSICFLVVFTIVFVIVVFFFIKNLFHETVVAATLVTGNEAVGTADKTAVWQLTGTLLIIAAAWAQWDQALGEVPTEGHRG
jgi:hypothetical protein